jgi:hypothetical protein
MAKQRKTAKKPPSKPSKRRQTKRKASGSGKAKTALKTKRTAAALKAAETKRRKAASKEFQRRSKAAKLGWQRRKAIKGKGPPGRPPKDQIMHLVTLKFSTRAARGEPLRDFKRDLLIPAPRGASFKELKQIAEFSLPPDALPLLQHFTRSKVTIAEGPKTRAIKAKER